MKIIIDNVEFPFNEGCKLLKLKHGSNTESPFKEIEDFWNEIEPLTFKEIITTFNNLEQRRIALSYLGLENLSKEINSKLVSTETISKQTTWVNKDGVTETIKFEDKYIFVIAFMFQNSLEYVRLQKLLLIYNRIA